MNARLFLPAYYVRAGADVTFQATLPEGRRHLRWRCNGRELAGVDGPTLTLANVGTDATGTYSVVVEGEDASDVATLTVVAETHFTDFAAAGCAGAGSRELVLGFVLDGAGSKNVLLRGDGAGSRWQPEITLSGARPLGTVPVPPGAEEATLLTRLETGGYTLQVANGGQRDGRAQAEVMDLENGEGSCALVNGSARGFVGPAAPLRLTFALAGTTFGTVLVRGIGPALQSRTGLGDALAGTALELRDEAGALLGRNCGWGGDRDLAEVFARCGAGALPPDSRDSALRLTVPPGTYHVSLDGADGASGVGLIEVFEVPSQ